MTTMLRPVTLITGASAGIGAALAEKLARVGLETLQDLLFHLPLRYQDRTRVVPIGSLRPGQDAVIEGIVAGADIVMGRRRSLLVRLQDGSGTLSLRFYHFSNAQKEAMKRGTQLRCYGGAPRGLGAGDLSPRVPRADERSGAGRADPDADLPDHRGPDPAAFAPAHRAGAGATRPAQPA